MCPLSVRCMRPLSRQCKPQNLWRRPQRHSCPRHTQRTQWCLLSGRCTRPPHKPCTVSRCSLRQRCHMRPRRKLSSIKKKDRLTFHLPSTRNLHQGGTLWWSSRTDRAAHLGCMSIWLAPWSKTVSWWSCLNTGVTTTKTSAIQAPTAGNCGPLKSRRPSSRSLKTPCWVLSRPLKKSACMVVQLAGMPH